MTIKEWEEASKLLDFAFQPIIHVNNQEIYGVEALLRNHEKAGFKSIQEVFDKAYDDNILYTLDLFLRKKALLRFSEINFFKDIKFFYNLDNRVLEMPNFSMGNTEKIIEKFGMNKNSFIFEISEKHNFKNISSINNLLTVYKERGYNIAIDDFGSGYSNLQKLFHIEVDILKIDRFFINEIDKSSKKKVFLASIVNLVHSLGGKVVAEGVETLEEYLICRKIGCDLVQGFFVEKPLLNLSKIQKNYNVALESDEKYDAFKLAEREIIEKYTLNHQTLSINNSIDLVLKMLKDNKKIDVIPIIDSKNKPIGIIKESSIKEYLLTPFGKEILKRKQISDIMNNAIAFDINTTINKLIEIFSFDDNIEEIILTEYSQYFGVVTKDSLIKMLNEKNMY